MKSYAAHQYWRIRFLSGQGTFYALRNLQFRASSAADPVVVYTPPEDGRVAVGTFLTFSEELAGTYAADLFLYDDPLYELGWSSNEYPVTLPDNLFIAQDFGEARAVSYISLTATSGLANPTEITSFAIDFSDDGTDWTESQVFTTDGTWAEGEERLFVLPHPDSSLPVFSFLNNWKEPMTERLAFRTDVIQSREGGEQRRSLRTTPRRTFDADYLLTGPERTFWTLFINTPGGGEIAAPLYWEVVTLPAALTAGVDNEIAFDTTRREWEYHESMLALLIRKDSRDYEVVQIKTVNPDGVVLANPVTRPWPVGTKLMPLRRAVLEQAGELNHKTGGVATVTARIRVIGPNPWTPGPWNPKPYGAYPLYEGEPNWVNDLRTTLNREVALLDTQIGLTYQVDTLGRTFDGQEHRWFLDSREKMAAFRDLIYRHQGRRRAFWLPTFKHDFKLAAPALLGDTQIIVQNTGYRYTGGPKAGRKHIVIVLPTGSVMREIISVDAGATPETEILILDRALLGPLDPALVRRISFVDTARFDSDEFEISHWGGVDLHHEVSATFRTFDGERPLFEIVNPGFEHDGVVITPPYGWQGDIRTQGPVSGRFPVAGNWMGRPIESGADGSSEQAGYQILDIPDFWWPAIDAGKVTAGGLGGWYWVTNNQYGRAGLFLQFLNAAGAQIGQRGDNFLTAESWASFTVSTGPVPAGTRKLRVRFWVFYVSGAWSAWDEMRSPYLLEG